MREYFRLFAEGGIEKLKEVNYYRPESELNAHTTTLEPYFRERNNKGSPEQNQRTNRDRAQCNEGARISKKNFIFVGGKLV